MDYRWSTEDTPTFTDQGEAEEWLRTHWQDLADAGVDEVTLLCDGEVVYGPMNLGTG